MEKSRPVIRDEILELMDINFSRLYRSGVNEFSALVDAIVEREFVIRESSEDGLASLADRVTDLELELQSLKASLGDPT